MIRKLLSLITSTLSSKPSLERSSQWPKVRASHLVVQPVCQVCKGTKDLNVHHIKPVHLYPHLELVSTNLITLCEANQCHFTVGHGRDWKAYNPNVVADATFVKDIIESRRYQ